MKLKPVQLAWIVGTIAFVGAIILDIVGAIVFPNTLMLAIGGVLMLLSWKVGPSLSDMERSNRRG